MPDQFKDFAEMTASVDPAAWEVEVRDGTGPWVIIAPHGGTIERPTDLLAQEIAGADLPFYVFRSLVLKKVANLHITSRNFNHDLALALLAQCDTAVAIHGSADTRRGDVTTQMGGIDAEAREAIARSLAAANFPTALASGRLAGDHPINICNRCRSGSGVQLEIPLTLRRQLRIDVDARSEFVAAIRRGLRL